MARRRIAMLTPLPPTRSGVAHYASLVIPALAQHADVRAFDSPVGFTASDYDDVFYQLGNNPHHEWIYREAMRTPGIVVLHDLVLHHLIVEMTLARGDAEGYVAALEANHGPAGAAWARGRANGMHAEIANFLMPASVDVAQRARGVIVHNHYARERLLSFGVTTPIHVAPHPYVPETRTFDRDALRARHGFTRDSRVIGFFGFLTSAKRAEVVLEAFRIARERDRRLALLIVGEPAPNIDVATLRSEGVVTTGYVDDDEFPAYYAIADALVNLRYPSAGETSGTLIRALDAGKPVAVSDYAQFAELPDDCVFKVALGEEVPRLVEFFTSEFASPAAAQRRWLAENATLEKTVAGYLECGDANHRFHSGAKAATGVAALQMFPQLEVVEVHFGDEITITLRNHGPVIRTRTYGLPEYRLIAKLLDGEREVQSRWLALPGDLHTMQTATIRFAKTAHANVLRLHHALQDIPLVDDTPFAEVRDVR